MVSLVAGTALLNGGGAAFVPFLQPSHWVNLHEPNAVASLRGRRTSMTGVSHSGETLSTSLAIAFGASAAAMAFTRRHRRATALRAEPPTAEQWHARVKRIQGDRAVFDVTIPKPLGLNPANFPNRPGVGVAKITPGGNTDILNRKVIVDNEEGMWVLEGDEVVAVNGESVEGKTTSEVGPLVRDSEGDSVTLTLCRSYYAGPVKVVFLPSGKTATMKRGIEISSAAKVGVEDVSFSCKEGWCKACWHSDQTWGTVFRACESYSSKRPPPKLSRRIPEKWDNVMPLVLLNWKETFAKLKREGRLQPEIESQ
eukprot:TRINITY_DN97372_c0_g1_i1.p1 TRINITY_DN97372_c0_g1~~TRINITY_DN97372_c0_g1_i1.p1  ORF type:complete len:311 (-),score=52.35 TRINITY_DN97372_c0_g1_i1:388-1320(-)